MVSMHDDVIDSETYLTVLENDILPLMNPYPGEKSVLINDNAPVHNKAAIMTLCDGFGVITVFLEPYSYDYNPIELVFHSAKDYCRMHYPTDDPNDPISKHFKEALMNSVDGNMACDYFAHCHVKVTAEERVRAIN
jgi:DDE superfamily endonuclease